MVKGVKAHPKTINAFTKTQSELIVYEVCFVSNLFVFTVFIFYILLSDVVKDVFERVMVGKSLPQLTTSDFDCSTRYFETMYGIIVSAFACKLSKYVAR